jgi:hypothetical protein
MNRKLLLLLSGGVFALSVASAFADGDGNKGQPEQPQAGALVVSSNDDPYPAPLDPDTSDHRPVTG